MPAAAVEDPARTGLHRRVMGTDAHVVAVGRGPDPERAMARLEDLERRWTRFDAGSELSRINGAAGRPVVAGPDTALLVECCRVAWRRTAGRFDPTVLDALEALGYDRDFAQVAASGSPGPATGSPSPGLAELRVDRTSGLVQLPAGARIDPGGLGKGLAADLVAVEAADRSDGGGILVSVGGDLRVAGTAPAEGWEIELDHLVGGTARVNLVSGALATSSVLRRRWEGPDGPRHHVVDPRTGRPADGAVASVSVVAAEAWWAEVLATVLLLDAGADGTGDVPEELLDGAGALVTGLDGSVRHLGPLGRSFLVLADPAAARFRTEDPSADPLPGSPRQEQRP